MIDKLPSNRVIKMKQLEYFLTGNKTHFQTKQSIDGLYLARPVVTWKLVFAVCFGTGILTTTPRANILAPNTLLTWKLQNMKVDCKKTKIKLLFFCSFMFFEKLSYLPWHLLPCVYDQVHWLLVKPGTADSLPL